MKTLDIDMTMVKRLL